MSLCRSKLTSAHVKTIWFCRWRNIVKTPAHLHPSIHMRVALVRHAMGRTYHLFYTIFSKPSACLEHRKQESKFARYMPYFAFISKFFKIIDLFLINKIPATLRSRISKYITFDAVKTHCSLVPSLEDSKSALSDGESDILSLLPPVSSAGMYRFPARTGG